VDEPAEQISSANVVRTDGDRIPRFGSWRCEAEGAMRAPAVVVLGVGPKRPIKMPPTEDEVQSRHSARIVSITRSACALAFGARKGVRITCIPSERSTVSNGRQNFESRSRMRNRMAGKWPSRSIARFRACWVTQAESGAPSRDSGGSAGSRTR
jgi:hypothetical protein